MTAPRTQVLTGISIGLALGLALQLGARAAQQQPAAQGGGAADLGRASHDSALSVTHSLRPGSNSGPVFRAEAGARGAPPEVSGDGARQATAGDPLFAQPGVTVMDHRDDVDQQLAECALTVNPLSDIRGSSIKVIESLAANPRPPGCKKLKGYPDLWRVRVGDYRVIYRFDLVRGEIYLVPIGHRREIYRDKA